jgi:branched-chain amino acid transport system substrate-binding protein
VSKLKQDSIDILFYGGYHSEAGLIVRQMRDQKLKTILIGGEGLTTNEYWSITGDAGEGTLMSFNPDPRRMPEAAEAVKRIRAAGYEPEGYTMYSYAAVQVLAQAMEQTQSTDVKKLSAAIHSGKFKTVTGDLSFDEKGDVRAPGYIIYKWTKGTYVPLEE